jgi:hypothetical protein
MDFDTHMVQAMLFGMGLWLLAVLIGVGVAYLLIKSAVRDGIRQSGLIEAIQRSRPRDSDGPLPDWVRPD